ncbi:hypothetical protein [Achromobacter xylosoxidans]|uniref:hypothetical protein n=1 Tax=Alcaligenes xylosoxydans xylosoxydans TaxID=85698 RepID=UPI0006C340FB|nr:hypothetical protein [Achromobacter xylosoxidans]CUI55506.1 Uncharacterised protein [Achromobacter xylosoxidans]
MARAHNVQTPGAVATPSDDANPTSSPSTQPAADDAQGATAPTTPPESVTDIAAAGMQIAEPPKAKKSLGKPSREDYAKMRAADVDPSTITAPVLTLDGYVVPAPKDGK